MIVLKAPMVIATAVLGTSLLRTWSAIVMVAGLALIGI